MMKLFISEGDQPLAFCARINRGRPKCSRVLLGAASDSAAQVAVYVVHYSLNFATPSAGQQRLHVEAANRLARQGRAS